ncbi:MAG: hypothetical protein MJ171_08385, partial [Clostridia bacterium]|nr:hypothetical protein [Clostridia bacterium]
MKNNQILLKTIGLLSLIGGIATVPCILCCRYYSDAVTFRAFLAAFSVYMIIGLVLFMPFAGRKINFKGNESFVLVGTSWLFVSVMGSLPFIFAGYPIMDSIFESVAGFTTTAATVLGISSLSNAFIMWKAILNWSGGMGMLLILFTLAPILRIKTGSISTIEKNELTGPKVSAKYLDSAKGIYLIYLLFTVAEFTCLLIGHMTIFDALTNSLSGISTSGLYIRPQSADIFESGYIKGVVTVFSILASCNFTMYFLVASGRAREAIRNVELRTFLSIVFFSTLVVSFMILRRDGVQEMGGILLDSVTQVVSFISTSGYLLADVSSWPEMCKTILLFLLFIGGCTLSTTGSLKVTRIITIFKLIKRGIFKQIHPRATKAVVIGGKAMPAKQVSNITAHILLYILIFFFGCVLLSFNNMSLEATISASLGVFSNAGTYFNGSLVTNDFSILSGFSKAVCSMLMLFGKLELYSLLLLL